MALQPSRLVLYSRQSSSCSARVRIAASLKDIPLEIVPCEAINLRKDRQYTKKNPNATVPTLEAHYGNGESVTLTQSLSMLDFLEESYAGRRPLIPPVTDMAARCRVRDLALLMACDTQPLHSTRVLNDLIHTSMDPKVLSLSKGNPLYVNDEETQARIRRIWTHRLRGRSMVAYEAIAKESAGKFSVGDEVSIADVCLVATVQGMYKAGMMFSEKRSPTIKRIVETCGEIDAFRHLGVYNVSRSHTSPF